MHLKEFQKYHCLIVDREMFMRRVLRQMLRQLGVAEVEEAKDGAHAFSICAHTTFHIVVTELLMPVMGGVELTAQIRRGKGVDNQIPIIGYTADITPELLRSARDAGINELMTRPFSSGVLIKKWAWRYIRSDRLCDAQLMLGHADGARRLFLTSDCGGDRMMRWPQSRRNASLKMCRGLLRRTLLPIS